MDLKVIGKNGFQKFGFVDPSGNFKVYVDQAGTYKIEIFNINFYFEPVIVSIISDEDMPTAGQQKQYSAYIYSLNTGGKGQRLLYPLQLDPSHKIKYFDQEEPFNPMVYLKHPFVLMGGLSFVMMYMMKSVPKEEMEEY